MEQNVFATHAYKGQLVTTRAEQPDHDLTPIWSPATADLIRDAWLCARDGTDREPIRQYYRDNPTLRAVIADIMREQ